MTWRVILTALMAVIIFGASPVAAKIAVQELPAMTVAVLRTVLGGVAVLPLILLYRVSLPKVPQQRYLVLLSGFCGFIGFPVFFTLGVKLTSANHASLILASLPVLTGAMSMACDRKTPKLMWWYGCLIAMMGELFLISFVQDSAASKSSVIGDLIVILSTFFAAAGYVAGARVQKLGYSAKATTFWGVLLFAIVLVPMMPFVIDLSDLKSASVITWASIAYLAIGVTIIGYMMWYWALGNGETEKVGLIQFFQPVSGIILAWLILSESISLSFVLAAVLILVGVWVAIKAR